MDIITFKGKPYNYKRIDNYVSRSAQPMRDDFSWLKGQGVTDIINFRTMYEPAINFNEKEIVEQNGMRYHNIPSRTRHPQILNVLKFLDIVNEVKQNNGKVHIHCKAGADRTGMYSWIYKHTQKLGTPESNKEEMLRMGHDRYTFPNLIGWIEHILSIKNKTT